LDPLGYYSLLGIKENATNEEILKAYRIAVLRFHPDRNKTPVAHNIMAQINNAYEVLSDHELRKQYDMGSTSLNNAGRVRSYDGSASGRDRRDHYYSLHKIIPSPILKTLNILVGILAIVIIVVITVLFLPYFLLRRFSSNWIICTLGIPFSFLYMGIGIAVISHLYYYHRL